MLHLAWSAYEATLDCLVTELLGLSDSAGHYVTAGMNHSGKVKIAKVLLKRSDRPKAAAIRGKISEMANQHKRNVLIHSYVLGNSEAGTVSFINRRMERDYEGNELEFKIADFMRHVAAFTEANGELQVLCGYSDQRLDEFCKAALNANANSVISPEPPASKA